MTRVPAPIAAFLEGKRIAVAGVSRKADTAGNAIFRKLRDSGYDAIPLNPHVKELEHAPCYPSVTDIPGPVDGIIVATHPKVSAQVVREAAARGVRQIWFHRSFGNGSVSDAALEECRKVGITPIVGGCPLMYCEPVDVGHRCMRGWLNWRHRLPAA